MFSFFVCRNTHKTNFWGPFLVVHWLRLHISNEGGMGCILVWGLRLHMLRGKKRREKKNIEM